MSKWHWSFQPKLMRMQMASLFPVNRRFRKPCLRFLTRQGRTRRFTLTAFAQSIAKATMRPVPQILALFFWMNATFDYWRLRVNTALLGYAILPSFLGGLLSRMSLGMDSSLEGCLVASDRFLNAWGEVERFQRVPWKLYGDFWSLLVCW